MKTKIIHFVVEGRGSFPMDMLRYDNCEPATDEDMQSINNGEYVSGPRRQIALKRDIAGFSLRRTLPGVTPERWESFSWKVVQYERMDVMPNGMLSKI